MFRPIFVGGADQFDGRNESFALLRIVDHHFVFGLLLEFGIQCRGWMWCCPQRGPARVAVEIGFYVEFPILRFERGDIDFDE